MTQNAEDRCPKCSKLLLTEHEIFLFYKSPDAIRGHPGLPDAEWQPCPETPPIPSDNGPARVAYVWGGDDHHPSHKGDPVVQIFDGPLADILWVPCDDSTVEYAAGVWAWYCQPIAPKNPAEEDWMRSISS